MRMWLDVLALLSFLPAVAIVVTQAWALVQARRSRVVAIGVGDQRVRFDESELDVRKLIAILRESRLTGQELLIVLRPPRRLFFRRSRSVRRQHP